jgi:hypothetical protein
LLNTVRNDTIVAVVLTELYSLHRRKLLEIMSEFPDWADEVKNKALARLNNPLRKSDSPTAKYQSLRSIEQLQGRKQKCRAPQNLRDATTEEEEKAEQVELEELENKTNSQIFSSGKQHDDVSKLVLDSERRILEQLKCMQKETSDQMLKLWNRQEEFRAQLEQSMQSTSKISVQLEQPEEVKEVSATGAGTGKTELRVES